MNDCSLEPDSELADSLAVAVQKQPPSGCFCYRATLDELLSDDMMTPVLRSAGYERNELREMMAEMARRGETRCSCD